MAKNEGPLPASLASYQAMKVFNSFLLNSNSLSNPLSIVTVKIARSPVGCDDLSVSDDPGIVDGSGFVDGSGVVFKYYEGIV